MISRLDTAAAAGGRAVAPATGVARFQGQPVAPPRADGYVERLLKYLPAELVTLYATLVGLLAPADAAPAWLGWAAFTLCQAATPVYLRYAQGVHSGVQLAVSAGAFFVWAFALGGPFAGLSWYRPGYAAALLSVYTFLAAAIRPPGVGNVRKGA